jgi:hypothetical protein
MASLFERGQCMCCNILIRQLGAAITPGTHLLHVRSFMEIFFLWQLLRCLCTMVILLRYAHNQVFVNPFGGKGSGVQTWEQVAPLFEKAKIDMTVVFISLLGAWEFKFWAFGQLLCKYGGNSCVTFELV